MITFVRMFIDKCYKKFLRTKVNVLKWTLVLVFLVMVSVWTRMSPRDMLQSNNIISNPEIVWWTEGFAKISKSINCGNGIKCDMSNDHNTSKNSIRAYLFYGSNIDFNNLPLPRNPGKIIWGLYHEESPRNVEEFLHEPVLSLFNITSTFSRYSDLPCTLQYLASLDELIGTEYYVETAEKNLLLKELAPVLYLQSDCETSSERDAYVKQLMKHIKVDSYGECLNNKQLPKKFKDDYINNLNEHEFLSFIAKYKFVIAIENGVCEDYITEKLWRALKVGSVPIYFGSLSINDWLPNNRSAILLQDFNTVEKLGSHIMKLMDDDELYEEYLQHKIRRVVNNARLVKELKLRPWCGDSLIISEKLQCLVCEKVHEKMGGSTRTYIADKSHYNCPKPISALTLKVNPENNWVSSWELAKRRAKSLYDTVIGGNIKKTMN